ncbi:hypothetical protein MY8738_008766 [Beauveria namnaoensis]
MVEQHSRTVLYGRCSPRPRSTTTPESRPARCSGDRPTCRRCTERHIPCHYTARPGEVESQTIRRENRDLRVRASEHEEVVALLRRLSEHDAQGVFRRLRAGAAVAAILGQVQAGDALLQMAVAPETRFQYSFLYRAEMPAGCHGTGDNPYLNSVVYEAASLFAAPPSSAGDSSGGPQDDAVYLFPFHAARIVEPRLRDAKMAPWTSVCDDEALMRELLGIFFGCEYQFTSAFHKDYFLDEATGRTEFCSSLLVNFVLAYASVRSPQLQYSVNSFKAEVLRRKLEHWFANLPASLDPRNIVLPAQLQLHMYYHHLLLSIYEPLVDAVAPYQYTPQGIVASSPGSEGAALEELRATVMLIAKGLHDQRRNHYLAEALWRVLRGRMQRGERVLLRRALSLNVGEQEEPQQLAQTVRSHWPVSVVKRKEDLESKMLGYLVESYAHLNVEGDEYDDGDALTENSEQAA